MLSVYKANSGRDKFPALVKRQRVYKKLDRVQGWSVEPDDDDQSYYRKEDLGVGKTINILCREVFIYDADVFTRNWYKENMKTVWPSNLLEGQDKPAPQPERKPPPHIGYGSEEDSLGSWNSLHPKVPKKDITKLMKNSRKILRFEADLISKKPEDAGTRPRASWR